MYFFLSPVHPVGRLNGVIRSIRRAMLSYQIMQSTSISAHVMNADAFVAAGLRVANKRALLTRGVIPEKPGVIQTSRVDSLWTVRLWHPI
jgi:hypothetical protein